MAEFDAAGTYAVFHYDDETAGEAIEDLDPGELVAEVNGRSGDLGGDWLHPDRWVPDLARSAFVATQVRPAALQPLITATTDDDRAVVWGRDIGRALKAGSLSLDELTPDGYRQYPHLLLRPRTDGSLLDAMRAATWTMSAPDDLCDIGASLVRHGYVTSEVSVVDTRWEPTLDQVGDDALRRHLHGLCLDARWARIAGAHFLGPGECPGPQMWILPSPVANTVVRSCDAQATHLTGVP
ncbi:hypothetical protein [Micromonospora humida]|uniref:hypothetical protein n=1 Tax=Micromonospora humida TaxID=2809018 RepID=UPI00343306B8